MRTRGEAIRPLEKRLPIVDVAAGRIREAILGGVYRQGERLSDSRIAEELGTSRGSIREALKLVQALGLVVQKPNKGTFVISLSAEDMRDTYELRVALECHAARMLSRHHSEADLSALRRILDKIERAAEAGDQLGVSQLDRDFHEHLCLLSGSRRLHEVFDREVLSMLGFFVYDEQAYDPLSEMAREFRPLLKAIEASDENEAARLVESHVRRATDLLSERVEEASEEA
jgi:GntR family transcriptional regulator of gluconate operon